MPFSAMLGHVALVSTDISEENSASIIKMARIGELGTKLVVIIDRRMLLRNTVLVFKYFGRNQYKERGYMKTGNIVHTLNSSSETLIILLKLHIKFKI
jgi:hypothetical protein